MQVEAQVHVQILTSHLPSFAQKHSTENTSKSGYAAVMYPSMTLVLLKRITRRICGQGFGVSPSDWAG